MKAVTWHGKRDVRVDNVPDPTIQEPTDVIVRVTSTGICGSDLHLYEVLGPFLDAGDVLGHEPMGVVEAVGPEVTRAEGGGPRGGAVQHRLRHCFMCAQGLQSQCETTQVHEHGHGAALFGYTKLYGQVPGGQAEFPSRPVRATRCRSRCPRARPTSVSCSSPTCCRPRGRRSSTPRCPVEDGGRPRSRADRRHGVPGRPAPRHRRHRRRPRAGAPRTRTGAEASRCSTSASTRTSSATRSAT